MHKTIAAIAFGVASLIGVAAQAQAPSWYGSYDDPPRGSYTRSCREITAFDGRVWALCQSGGGRWSWSSARTSDCRGGGLENRDGRLMCAGGGWNGGGPGGGGRPPGGWRADIVLFEDAGYEGRVYEVIGDMPDLGQRLQRPRLVDQDRPRGRRVGNLRAYQLSGPLQPAGRRSGRPAARMERPDQLDPPGPLETRKARRALEAGRASWLRSRAICWSFTMRKIIVLAAAAHRPAGFGLQHHRRRGP